MKISEAFYAAAEFAMSRGARNLVNVPGTWESAVGENWWIAINAHGDDVQCSRGIAVPPRSIYIEFNGWPFGIINSAGGRIASGDIANEETFIAALRQHTPRVPECVSE